MHCCYHSCGSIGGDTGNHSLTIPKNPRGIYGLHIWENEQSPDRAGGFIEKFRTPQGTISERPRDDRQFQAIAADTIGRPTPANLRARLPKWKSLVDLRNNHGDPFQNGADATVLLFTVSTRQVTDLFEMSDKSLTSKFHQ
jgi:hypothetical protein